MNALLLLLLLLLRAVVLIHDAVERQQRSV